MASFLVLVICLLASSVASHSWVERLNVYHNGLIDLEQSGYSRGNVLRIDPQFSDTTMTYHLPPDGRVPSAVLASDPICKQSQSQADSSSALSVRSGEAVVLQWNENGHITQPWNNPPSKSKAGKVYVYGTVDSREDDSFLAIHNVWTGDGSGGDQRGRLLYSGDFDNGECYLFANNKSNDLEVWRELLYPAPGPVDPAQNQNRWCTANVPVPFWAKSSLLSLYWVWDFPFAGTARSDFYTTCMDVLVV